MLWLLLEIHFKWNFWSSCFSWALLKRATPERVFCTRLYCVFPPCFQKSFLSTKTEKSVSHSITQETNGDVFVPIKLKSKLCISHSIHSWYWFLELKGSLKERSSCKQIIGHLLKEFREIDFRRHLRQASRPIWNLVYLYFPANISSPSRLGSSFCLQKKKKTRSRDFSIHVFLLTLLHKAILSAGVKIREKNHQDALFQLLVDLARLFWSTLIIKIWTWSC